MVREFTRGLRDRARCRDTGNRPELLRSAWPAVPAPSCGGQGQHLLPETRAALALRTLQTNCP